MKLLPATETISAQQYGVTDMNLLTGNIMSSVTFTLNNRSVTVSDLGRLTLLSYLRNVERLRGAKEACGMGHCGACSVLIDGELARSCVVLMKNLDGKSVETIEKPGEGWQTERHPGILSGCRSGPVRLLHVRHGHCNESAASEELSSDR